MKASLALDVKVAQALGWTAVIVGEESAKGRMPGPTERYAEVPHYSRSRRGAEHLKQLLRESDVQFVISHWKDDATGEWYVHVRTDEDYPDDWVRAKGATEPEAISMFTIKLAVVKRVKVWKPH